MAVEAVILYRPSGFEGDGEFRLARTTAGAAVLAVARAAIDQARATARIYEGLDPALAGASLAEADRLDAVLRQIVPGYPGGGLRLVPPPTAEPEP